MRLEEVAIFTEKFFKEDFSGTALDTTQWDAVIGAGQNIVVADSNLKISSGTIANSETVLKRKVTCKLPIRLGFLSVINQRLPDQEIRIGIESVSGNNRVELLFGDVDESVKIVSFNNGYYGSSEFVSIKTGFPSLFIHELSCFFTEFRACSKPFLSTTDANSFKEYILYEKLPDNNEEYQFFVRVINKKALPLSTEITIDSIYCLEYGSSFVSGTSGTTTTSTNTADMATAVNQQTEIARLTEIRDKVLVEGTDITGVTMPAGGASARGWLSAIWQIVSTRLPALVNSRIPVDNSGVTQPISATALPLPTGAATAAIQTTIALNQQTEIARLTEIRDKVLAEGTDITGVVMPSGGVGARGWLSSIWQLLSAMNPTVKSALININAAGDNIIITPSAPTKSIKLCGVYFTAASIVTTTFKSGTTAFSGAMSLTDHATDYSYPITFVPGQSFVIHLGSAIAVTGYRKDGEKAPSLLERG